MTETPQDIANLLNQVHWRLVEAEQKLRKVPQTKSLGRALSGIHYAASYTVAAMDSLAKESDDAL